MQSQDEVIWAAFMTFDTNCSGFIERQELGQILDKADVKDVWTAEVCQDVSQKIIERFDKDGDDRLNFEDWKSIMQECWDKKVSGASGDAGDSGRGGMTSY